MLQRYPLGHWFSTPHTWGTVRVNNGLACGHKSLNPRIWDLITWIIWTIWTIWLANQDRQSHTAVARRSYSGCPWCHCRWRARIHRCSCRTTSAAQWCHHRPARWLAVARRGRLCDSLMVQLGQRFNGSSNQCRWSGSRRPSRTLSSQWHPYGRSNWLDTCYRRHCISVARHSCLLVADRSGTGWFLELDGIWKFDILCS